MHSDDDGMIAASIMMMMTDSFCLSWHGGPPRGPVSRSVSCIRVSGVRGRGLYSFPLSQQDTCTHVRPETLATLPPTLGVFAMDDHAVKFPGIRAVKTRPI